MNRVSLVAAAVGLLLGMPAIAHAAAESEPNDGIHQFTGPMAADTRYDGILSNDDDQDWYSFHTANAGTFTAEVSNAADPDASFLYFDVTDTDGDVLSSKMVSGGASETLQYTAPGAGRYFLVVYASFGDGNGYAAEVSGPIGTGPAARVPLLTPNDNGDPSSAFGPLAGATLYEGRIDTQDEEDWFRLYTSGPGDLGIALTNVPDDASGAYVGLYDRNGKFLNEQLVDEHTIGHIDYQAPAAATYLIRVITSFAAGNEYQLEATPGALLTDTPPPADSVACAKATKRFDRMKKKVKRAKAGVKKAKAKVRGSKGAKKKRKAKRRLAKTKLKMKKAKSKKRDARSQQRDACN